MKKLSDEELVMGIECIVRVSTARKAELLSRLSKGQRAIEAMEKIKEVYKVEIAMGYYITVEEEKIAEIIQDYEQAKEKK